MLVFNFNLANKHKQMCVQNLKGQMLEDHLLCTTKHEISF